MRYLWIGLSLFVVIILGFGAIIAHTNYYTYKERMEEKQRLEDIKKSQQGINEEFYRTKQQKSQEISQTQQEMEQQEKEFIKSQTEQVEKAKMAEAATGSQDQDRDGLTREEEDRLGTSDYNTDSDLDGVPDKEDIHPAGGGENYKFTVHWQHNGYDYTTQFGIPEDRYLWYRNKPRGYCCEGWNKFATYMDPTIQTIAEDITDNARSQGESCLYCVAIDFVQSMMYEKDIDYNTNPEYPKYAIETIVDEKGDCEDTSFLMASILKALNIDTVVLIYSDHAAVGVRCDGCTGTYYNYKDGKYYFLETTGYSGNWEIGSIWGKYGDETPQIIDI